MDYSDLEFDEEKYYLGSLCKRSHDWNNTGRSLRDNTKHCIRCRREKIERRVKENGRYYLGTLCGKMHEFEDTGKSLRLSSTGQCTLCRKEWSEDNVEKIVKYGRERWQKVKDTENAIRRKKWKEDDKKGWNKYKAREYRRKNKDKVKIWDHTTYENNKLKRNLDSRMYYATHSESVLEKQKEYRENHIKEYKEYQRKYYDEHKERIKENSLYYYHTRSKWKGVIDLIESGKAPDIVVVKAMEIMKEFINIQLELRRLYREKKWKEYIMRVNQLIDEHGQHLSALLIGEVREPQFLLRSINRATNTHLGALREHRKEVVTNAFNRPDEIPTLIEL